MKNPATISRRYPLRPCTMVYILLVSLTLITWQLCRMGASGLDFALLVLVFALIKGALIGDYFMALRGIGSLWRWTIMIWLLIIGLLITLAFVTAA
jgi:cytochrome c oxidase subunit IV